MKSSAAESNLGGTRAAVSQHLGADRPSPGSGAAGSAAPSPKPMEPRRRKSAADFAELVKARLTALVLLTTAVGFYLGLRGPMDYLALSHVFFGTAAAAA